MKGEHVLAVFLDTFLYHKYAEAPVNLVIHKDVLNAMADFYFIVYRN
ncbi:hypothetical protein JOC85_001161 [Bacillus mesophilus]|uniref:Uncharacterized protein n=1 Tax=Bacillus mesophilus TaxID=1808955 RepID=A0A6M0Q4F2_9BACI|nr:hypothetical protein [Bacillus mesophilus]MBM7660394.1 hypothetical protein [Bacillus mesophilus]NEY71103.1 hypothetical protein [Bacillus mesophilus]